MDFLRAVINANVEIYNFLRDTPRQILCQKLSMGYGGDISTRADIEAESIFVKHLSSFGSIYSEESGMISDNGNLIVIDPIDGSGNFVSNIPFFGTSVAKKRGGEVTHAIVTNLSNGILYIKAGDIFEKRSLFSDIKYPIVKNDYSSVGIFEKSYASDKLHDFFKKSTLKYRSMGALALSLALAREVNFVLYEGMIREFDIAAGWHICEGLFRFKNDKILLVSKDKGIFDKISDFIKEQSVNESFHTI